MAVDMAMADRLKAARAALFPGGPGEAADALGVNKFTYTQHESGRRGIPAKKAIRYATFFHVRLDWLLKNSGPMKDGQKVPVVGYVGAGAEVFPEPQSAKGAGLQMTEATPRGIADCVAVTIRGDSMHPLGDGWLIFYQRVQEGVPDDCVNRLCVVQVHDGPTLLKTLRPGKGKLWTLESWNAPVRTDVRLDWAARVIDIRPR